MTLYVTIPILDRLTQQAGLHNFTLITNLGTFISSIVGIVLILASVLTLFYLAWGGLNWTMAGGDKGKVEEARNRITGAIIGLVIVAVSWALFLLVNDFLGLGIAGASSGSTSSTNTSGTPSNSSLTAFTGLAACPCASGGCAAQNAVSQLSSTTDCRLCTTGGWSSTGAPASCPNTITCGQCP